jgi:cytoskeletal protein CcmA (bactofilin family)
MFSRSTDTYQLPEMSAAPAQSTAPSTPYLSVASSAALPPLELQGAEISNGPIPITRMSPPAAPAATVVPGNDSRSTPGKVSVIGNDLTILGQGITIISKGSLQLDGVIQGNLHGTEILVGEKGRVDGTIAAQSVVIRGTVNGTIRALRVALQEGARVDGEIHHHTLILDAKAHFEGKVRRPQTAEELMPNLDPASHDKKVRAS